jgi:hypothetical protein
MKRSPAFYGDDRRAASPHRRTVPGRQRADEGGQAAAIGELLNLARTAAPEYLTVMSSW